MNRQMNVGQLIEYLSRYEKHIPVYLDGAMARAMAPDTGECIVLDCLRLDLELEDMKYNPDYNPDDWSD